MAKRHESTHPAIAQRRGTRAPVFVGSRSFTLLAKGVADGVRASLADGVATVIVPTAKESKPRQTKLES